MAIPRRDLDFDLRPETVPLDWAADSAYVTTLVNALSLLFPEGERFFMESVKQQKPAIRDEALLAAIAGFIGQEAMHAKEHRALNELLVAHGYAESPEVEARLRAVLVRVRRKFAPLSQLAVTCALEHFTAMMAEALLADERMQQELHESVRGLWLWHALEENEHKAVAFDVYEAAGGGYARRVAMMAFATLGFFTVMAIVHARLMKTRGVLHKPWTWLRGATRLWIYPGYFARLVPVYFTYFKPWFHPNERDTKALLARWREALFGPGGQLRPKLRLIA
ncbi:MAG TPA: metal-dependent hydrolase [Kofleriaceae bacterium]|nr:metal-dependent hydrolase [Kofleriaceae bacterium]